MNQTNNLLNIYRRDFLIRLKKLRIYFAKFVPKFIPLFCLFFIILFIIRLFFRFYFISFDPIISASIVLDYSLYSSLILISDSVVFIICTLLFFLVFYPLVWLALDLTEMFVTFGYSFLSPISHEFNDFYNRFDHHLAYVVRDILNKVRSILLALIGVAFIISLILTNGDYDECVSFIIKLNLVILPIYIILVSVSFCHIGFLGSKYGKKKLLRKYAFSFDSIQHTFLLGLKIFFFLALLFNLLFPCYIYAAKKTNDIVLNKLSDNFDFQKIRSRSLNNLKHITIKRYWLRKYLLPKYNDLTDIFVFFKQNESNRKIFLQLMHGIMAIPLIYCFFVIIAKSIYMMKNDFTYKNIVLKLIISTLKATILAIIIQLVAKYGYFYNSNTLFNSLALFLLIASYVIAHQETRPTIGHKNK